MTVYAELLKLTLADGSGPQHSLGELISDALARRETLARESDGATRLAAALAYDAALVRLCDQLGLEHDLTGASAGPEARGRAEARLATQLPELQAAAG